MPAVPIRKRLHRSLNRNALFITRRIISRLPDGVFKFLTPCFVAFGRLFMKSRYGILLKNLHMAFGREKTEQEICDIAKACLNSISLGMIELIYFLDRPGKIMEKVAIEGKENLDAALDKGQGAILLSAHFGNFGLMFLRIALQGYKTSYIMRKIKDKRFEQFISDFTNEKGIQTIYSLPQQQCIERSLKSLRDNQILFILLDQHQEEASGVSVDFFGRPASTATGPVIFSSRSGAPILPAFIVRDGAQHKIIISTPVNLETAQFEESALVRSTAQLTRIIEGYIRRYPHEWAGWLHRRWKGKSVVS